MGSLAVTAVSEPVAGAGGGRHGAGGSAIRGVPTRRGAVGGVFLAATAVDRAAAAMGVDAIALRVGGGTKRPRSTTTAGDEGNSRRQRTTDNGGRGGGTGTNLFDVRLEGRLWAPIRNKSA